MCCPTYADDMTLLTLHKSSMRRLLDIVYDHSRKWRYEYNAQKSHILVFGPDSSQEKGLYIGGEKLQVVSSCRHLGVPLATDTKSLQDSIYQNISKGLRSFHATLGLGSRYQPVPPLCLSKIYWSVSIPQITYGLEILGLGPQNLSTLESTHMYVAKVIQGLPRQTSTPSVLIPLKWWPIRAFVSYKRIMFLWFILLMPMANICKKLALVRICRAFSNGIKTIPDGPIRLMLDACVEYDLFGLVVEYCVSGRYISKQKWKQVVSEKINNVEKVRHFCQIMMYTKLKLLLDTNLTYPSVWIWWVFTNHHPKYVKHCKIMLRLLVGEHGLGQNVGRWHGKSTTVSVICRLCDMYVEESVAHILFVCPFNEGQRRTLRDIIEESAPDRLVTEMAAMDADTLTCFFPGGLRCNYIPEWDLLYINICEYIYCIYRTRTQDHEVTTIDYLS